MRTDMSHDTVVKSKEYVCVVIGLLIRRLNSQSHAAQWGAGAQCDTAARKKLLITMLVLMIWCLDAKP